MDFSNIYEFYENLEVNDSKSRRQWELTRNLKRLADTIDDESDKEKIRWECFVFDFELMSGKVSSIQSLTKEDGTIWDYPSYDEFNCRLPLFRTVLSYNFFH